MPRKLQNYIDGFMRFTEGKGSPTLFRKWAAIFTVGAALERKVWLTTVKGKLYPSQYILLVGGAGIGKSLVTDSSYELLHSLRTPETPFHLAPTSVTKASLIDALNEAERRIVKPREIPSVISFNSLSIIVNEFGVFLPAYDGEFMNALTDLWDCKRYAETRRTSKINIDIPNTQLNIFSATTPPQLNSVLPEGAWEHGFMSRMLIVYSGENIYTDLFAELEFDKELNLSLRQDLKEIYKLYGEFTISEDTKEAINAWGRGGCQPVPDHPKLVGYQARRPAHLLKLCLIAAVSDGADYVIELEHFSEALDWLVELETFMPDVFKSMKTGGDGRAIEECWHYAYQLYIKKKEPIPEHRLFTFLQERVPAHSVENILNVMTRSELLIKQITNAGGTGYVPKARTA